ncbi:hypothetical protein STCU_06134 [Strigomonas culicis]|uniref:Uncharacterized protein n=1 Tax=Strigomonas culicis TaxID=28005 RepID=S9UBA5_9TRYP|nr:hypothetical protein STCU_06364 [Strigomonas culicis]EPY26603.1 hypothetical protein STCU_06172 [Strigomonas culicis]EPY26679.1 hypothetical protein STCU_06134 [Strigomonas culicis]|eukprot:EPY26014.1 hypothetical protein STCU_06364 [Strigomonas culicis]
MASAHDNNEVFDSAEDMSGYFADAGVEVSDRFVRRLHRFYEKYNPSNMRKVEEYLRAYRGAEEQLFAILVSKYGPEPVCEKTFKSNNLFFSSEGDSVKQGVRCRFPKTVSAIEGNTDCETPYWAGGSSLVSHRDVLSLLEEHDTANKELKKCYVGVFGSHPEDCWNGMTYITNADGIAAPDTLFLSHIWAATLESGKTLFNQGIRYERFTLYCTDECQQGGGHERWRLCVYRNANSPYVLLRTVWDPIVVPEPLPLSHSHLSEDYGSFDSDPLSVSANAISNKDSAPQPLQPSETPVAQLTEHFKKILSEMEERILGRIISLDERVAKVEKRMDHLASTSHTK